MSGRASLPVNHTFGHIDRITLVGGPLYARIYHAGPELFPAVDSELMSSLLAEPRSSMAGDFTSSQKHHHVPAHCQGLPGSA